MGLTDLFFIWIIGWLCGLWLAQVNKRFESQIYLIFSEKGLAKYFVIFFSPIYIFYAFRELFKRFFRIFSENREKEL